MSFRRGGRIAWLPAYLLWLPCLLVGLVFVTGLDVDVNAVGDLQRVRVDLPTPAGWLDNVVLFTVGCVLLAVGAFLGGFALWRPDPDRHVLAVAVYGWFVAGAVLAAAAAALALWTTQGHVVDANAQGLQWRFLVGLRSGAVNLLTGIAMAAVSVTCLALSFGSPWPLVFRSDGSGNQSAQTAAPSPQ